jgi:hypothetical protein
LKQEQSLPPRFPMMHNQTGVLTSDLKTTAIHLDTPAGTQTSIGSSMNVYMMDRPICACSLNDCSRACALSREQQSIIYIVRELPF